MNPWIIVGALVGCIVAYFTGAGVQKHQDKIACEARVLKLQNEANEKRDAAVETQRLKGEKRVTDQTAIATEATQRANELGQRADAARAAADGLRQQVATLLAARARPASPNPAAPASRPAAPDPDVLLAGLLDQSLQRNQELARYADAARTAGGACERSYDALN